MRKARLRRRRRGHGRLLRSVAGLYLVSCVPLAATPQAATATVTCKDRQQHISVDIENAALPAILDQLSKCFDFEVEGLQNAERGETLSTTISGTLPRVLTRLLRNRNFMIVRSSDGGVARVAILNSDYGARSLKTRKGPVSKNVSKLKKSLELFSGP